MTEHLRITDLNIYYSQFLAVENINLSIESNTITACIGPSGCGKSTFLRTLNRMHEETPGAYVKGSIRYRGQDLYDSSVDPVQVRKQIGMVFQKANPFPTMTIRNNVLAGIRLQHQKLSRADLDNILEESLTQAHLWNEVKDRLDTPASRLSGGQQQRLCIARAIAIRPDLLLMDEPCSALDPISTRAIEDLIQELKQKYTIVMVTHNMQQAQRIADRTAFFNITEIGKPSHLVEYGDTAQMFSSPKHVETADYISGRFG